MDPGALESDERAVTQPGGHVPESDERAVVRPGGHVPESDERAVVRPGGDLLEGTPYRIVQPLGLGGMGEVFEAEHRALGHRVVVKVLLELYAARPDMRDRMRIEAQALARIRHPNLVMVTDFGETRAGHQFIVMERLVGWTLREQLESSTILDPREAAEIARQMLLGLHAAHVAGLVHRDVKPENVFLCATEDHRPFAKILDFGVAKIAEVGRDARTPLPLVVQTREGILLGTPRYYSPEQARQNRDLDARSDVYSVALVLYEMLTGHGPFDSRLSSLARLCQAHAHETPEAPSFGGGDVNLVTLDPVVLRALAYRREDRPPDALSFAHELEVCLRALGADEGWFVAPRPVFAGVADPHTLAEAPTSPAVFVKPPPAPPGASATVQADVSEPRAPRRLSDAPVVIDRLLERVLAGGPALENLASAATEPDLRSVPPRATSAARAAGDPTEPDLRSAPSRAPSPIADTDPMQELAPPAPLPAPRSSVPETAPMLDLAQVVRASVPPPSNVIAPASRGAFIAPAPRSQPVQRATWRLPALVIAALLVLAIVAFAIVRALA